MTPPAAYDHLRPTDADSLDYPDGIYRVVGTGEAGVTVLRVADADGRRVHTGELHAAGHDELGGFEPAANPDGNRPPGAAVASTLRTGYWSLRVFARQLTANPLPTAVALALLLAGRFGGDVLPLPDVATGVLALVGSLGLAYVGSGRLEAERRTESDPPGGDAPGSRPRHHTDVHNPRACIIPAGWWTRYARN